MKKTTARQKKFVAALGLHLLSHRLDVTADKYEKDGDRKTAYEVDKINHRLRKAMEGEELYKELEENSDRPVADILEELVVVEDDRHDEAMELLEEALYGEVAEETAEGEMSPEEAEEVMEEAGEAGETVEVEFKPPPTKAARKAADPEPAPPAPPAEPDPADIEARIARAKARAKARIAALHRRPSITANADAPVIRRASNNAKPPEQGRAPEGRRLRIRTLR